MAEQIAKFRFIRYEIMKSFIEIKDSNNISKELEVEFNRSSGINEEGLKYRLELKTSIKDKNENINIEVNAYGYFEFDDNIQEQERNIFFHTSAPAILFPYIRAYITSLTSLSGIDPIILPTLNLSSR